MKNSHTGKILIVDDEDKIRNILAVILRDAGYVIETAKDGFEALEKSGSFKPDLLIVDLQMPRMDGIETVTRIKERFPSVVAIILTAHGSIHSAVQAIKQGIYDYITKPFDNDQLILVVRRALDLHRLTLEVAELKNQLQKNFTVDHIVGDSAVMKEVKQNILRIAETDATVLIEGESGTGKELAARAIHFESKRREKPIVIIDCAAVPANLIESEFFGYQKGAFTDAREQRAGKFEEADGGTIFLDEIGELPLEAQSRLLRVIQEREFSRIGSATPIKIDVRIIAATNKNLPQQVADGKFREDLFYRLNVLKLFIPPLRLHSDDIPTYAQHFLIKHRNMFYKKVESLSPEALDILTAYEWRGNIRELENTIQRALLNATGVRLEVSDFDFKRENEGLRFPKYDPTGGLETFMNLLVERAERELIIKTLTETRWNRTEAAEKLKVSRKTLFNKMRQYGLGDDDTKEDAV
ncbi:MAG: sigma-54-dependent transcriptional regulator [Bacteroidota bacterium]